MCEKNKYRYSFSITFTQEAHWNVDATRKCDSPAVNDDHVTHADHTMSLLLIPRSSMQFVPSGTKKDIVHPMWWQLQLYIKLQVVGFGYSVTAANPASAFLTILNED